MVLEKLIAAATSSTYTWQQSTWKGDPAIVYLDGVTPPTCYQSRTPAPPEPAVVGMDLGTQSVPKAHAKLQNAHHQQLLQTIREDDSESRGENSSGTYQRPERLSTCSSRSTASTASSSGSSGFFGSCSSSGGSSDEEDPRDVPQKPRQRQRKHGCHYGRRPVNKNASWLSQLESSVVYTPKLTSMTRQTKLDEDQQSTDGSESASRKSSIESVVSNMSGEASPNGKSPLVALPEEEVTVAVDEDLDKSPRTSVSSGDTLASNPSSTSLELKNGPSSSPCNNNNSISREVSMAELELLKKLEAQNRLIETDAKSLNSLQSGHSRRSSDTSQISMTSGSSFPEREENSEDDLWILWGKIITEWDSSAKKKLPQIKDLVRRGIPHHFRGIVWQLLCEAHESLDKPKYADYMKTQSACEKVIRRDIARTYPEHDFFKKKDGVGQEALFNVMKAYSIHDREVGYCQGSAFIVGLLLMQMPEEEAFCVLVKIMQEYRMREMFKPSMAELGLCMFQLDTLVQEHIPDLFAHFQSQSIHTNLYASSWFLTVFSTSVPIALACRIMDCFLADGIEVIFRLALALLLQGRNELLLEDMEGVIRHFQRDMPTKFENDPETIFTLAFSLKINQKKMKKLEKEYTTMKTKEKEDEIEQRRLRTENRLLRQRVALLEQESNNLADRLIQGQVDRAEVEETTFVIKRELAAIKQHDLDTNKQLEEAKDRIRKLSAVIDDPSNSKSSEEMSLRSDIIKQKEEMIHCLQDELIKERLREAENEEKIRDLNQKAQDLESEVKKMRDTVPENELASLQEELAAAKLREAEANLALKELKTKVAELSAMWQKHLKRTEAEANGDVMVAPSTPKKLLGSFLEGGRGAEAARLEEELMTAKMSEVECQAELKESRLKVMELETQNQVIANQLKRQSEEVGKLRDNLESKNKVENRLEHQVREGKRHYADLEGRMKEDLMMARIRDAENSQCVAELTQKISSLEYKNQEKLTEGDLSTSSDQSNKVRELQDKIANLRAQVTRLSLMNSKLSHSLSLHNLASSFSSEGSSPSHTPTRQSPSPASSQSSLKISLSTSLQALH